ncbi:MAG: hypothetical protein KatS3mg114_1107 [Planctomycetaceae bacterium]|nr:MAG: hypothetical protein KatS3mg114_1107 [Planctomycetaceae bacterium]
MSWEYPALWIHQTPQIAEVGVITAQRLGLAAVPPWIELFSEPTIRAECLARWGEHLAPGNQLPADWQRLVADLPTAQRTWVLSRVARASQRAGQEELSQQTHAQLVPLLQAAPEPRPFTMPETAELVRWQKPSWEDHALWAAAGAQHAFWLQRARQTAQAEEWLETALQHCRAIGPTLPAIQQRLDEAEKLGATGLRQKIKTELDLRNDDEARQRIGAYRQGLTDVEAAAQERFRLQTAILVAAIREGMVDPAWRVAHSRSLDPQPLQREPYLTSEVGQWLAETYRRQNDAQQQQALRVAQEQLGAKPLARPWLAELEEARQARRWPEIHAVLARRDFKDLADDLDLWLTLQIAAQEPPDVVFNWIHSHREMTLREAAWEWAAVILTRRQLTSVVYEQIETISQATEKMSLIKGLVLGLHPYTPPMTAAPQTSYRPLQGAHDAPTVQR